MFIRQYISTNNKSGKTYKNFAIVESQRVGQTVVQKRLLKLDNDFDIPREKWGLFIKQVEKFMRNEKSLFETSFNNEYDDFALEIANKIIAKQIEDKEKEQLSDDSDYVTISVSKLDSILFRSVGVEHVALEGTRRLKLQEAFASLGLEEDQALLGVAAVAARMAHPSGETETCRWLDNNSALCELLDINITDEEQLCKISDLLYKYKDKIEEKLVNNLGNLIEKEYIVLLYNLSDSFFQGNIDLKIAKDDNSKENSSKGYLLNLGIILDTSGYLIKSKIFLNNVSETLSIKEMLKELKATSISKIIVDRQIATLDNLTWLDQHGYTYLAISNYKDLVFNLEVIQRFYNISNTKVMISKEIEDDSESYFYYNLLENIDSSVIETADDILTTKTEFGNNLLLESVLDPPGVYCLSSNDVKMTEKEMWNIYSYIIDIHSLFTYLESELDISQLDNKEGIRVYSHIFISILAYQCINSLRNELKISGIYDRWLNIIDLLASHGRMTSILHTKDGNIEYIRKTLIPESSQAKVYQALRISSQPGDMIKLNKLPRS